MEGSAGGVLSEKQLRQVCARAATPGSQIVSYQLRTASEEGIAGFLGDHFRMVLCVTEDDSIREINLFIKTLPTANEPKAEFIRNSQFFEKEALIFKLLEEIQKLDHMNPWCTKALVYNAEVLVMPDLSVHGYRTHPADKYFDENHVSVGVASLARFHAAFANYFTARSRDTSPDNFLDEYRIIVAKPLWESAWLKAAAKLTINLLKEFSPKTRQYGESLVDRLWKVYVGGSEGPEMSDDTVNVIIHKDLWANNILFRYADGEPTDAVLIDFQLVRYAPPAFDLMSFLYLTTSRNFRSCHETEVLQHYYTVFLENLDDLTKIRVEDLKYDFDSFLNRCERARMYGLVQATATLPYAAMEPARARKAFDDPDTFLECLAGDRSAPVLAFARENRRYLRRQLEVCEELVDTYLL